MRSLIAIVRSAISVLFVVLLASCTFEETGNGSQQIQYPVSGVTYLSFSRKHGYQVNYLEDGAGWLWYPGNNTVVREEWKIETVQGFEYICWKHPFHTFNPATLRRGGDFQCEPIEGPQSSLVSFRSGDIFDLKSGNVPYVLGSVRPVEFR